jgi:hypothetical protein
VVLALLIAAASALIGRRAAGRVARWAGLLVPGVLAALLAYRYSTSEVVVLEIALWVAQGLLALFFLAAGLPKVVGRGIDRWVGFDDLPRGLTILIGVAEVAGAGALVLPPLIGVVEWAVPLAAIGIAVVSLMASGFHVRAAEGLSTAETALLAALACAIAMGRWGELAPGPVVPSDALAIVIALLVPSVLAVLVLLARRPAGTPRRVVAAG